MGVRLKKIENATKRNDFKCFIFDQIFPVGSQGEIFRTLDTLCPNNISFGVPPVIRGSVMNMFPILLQHPFRKSEKLNETQTNGV